MIFNNSFQFQDAIEYINSCTDFTHKDGRISTPFGSKIFFVLAILVYIAVFYALTYFNTKYKYFDYSECCVLAAPIVIFLGLLLNFTIITNKVIDYKNNAIYCELLIFNILIFRYGYINGDDIAAVGNNVAFFHSKSGFTFNYYTSFLLKDGTLDDSFYFGNRYTASYNLAIVLANYFHKPLTLIKKNQQLTVVPGLRLSTITLNLYKIENEYEKKSALVGFAVFFLVLIIIWFAK